MHNLSKEKIYLPKAANQQEANKYESDRTNGSNSSLTPAEAKKQSVVDEYVDYLQAWSKQAANFDISDTLCSAVEKVKDFPKNSLAFVVGVKQLIEIASQELLETTDEISISIQKASKGRGVLAGVKVLVVQAADKLFLYLEPMYEATQDYIIKTSQYILGEKLSNTLGDLYKDYVLPLGNYLFQRYNSLVREKEIKVQTEENQYRTMKSFDGSQGSSEVQSQKREEVVRDLITRSNSFFNESKDFFAHTIFDGDSKNSSNPLMPEMLVEADTRNRPVYDPLPPAWVSRERRINEHSTREYRRSFGENAKVDLQTGELTSLAKLDLLTKGKVVS